MRILASFVVLAGVFLLSDTVQAKARRKSDSPEMQAKKACAAGDFRKGVDLLADLYVETNDPTYVFNQGRCYEQNHQWKNAIDRFREYLRKATDLTAEDTASVEKHIADCKRFLEEETAQTAPPPQPAPPPVVPATPPPPEVVVVEPPPPPLAPSGRPGAALRISGIVVGSVGVAALATGLAMNLKANSLGREANKSYNPDAESSYESYKTGAIIGYAVGGAALLTGTTLYLIGRSKGKKASEQIALVPIGGPTHAGLALSGGF